MDYDLNRIVKKFKVISRWSFDKLPPGYLVVSTTELLSKFNSSDLYTIRCQDVMKTVFKAIQFETMPKYIRGLFQMTNTERNLTRIKETCYPIR